jgi:UDP-glucose:(heptosyl)LPS alpha-1,3-glucosyltransferase
VKLAIVRQRYDASGSAERFIARALPALERAGAEVTLIARRAEGWGARPVLRVDPFRVGKSWNDRAFAEAARIAWLKAGFDLVQSHEPIPGCHVYRPEGELDLAALKETIEHPRLRAVLCPSKRMREEMRRAFRVSPEKLHLLYSGVDLEHFHPRERERLRGFARAELGCRPRDTVFLTVGESAPVSEALAAARNDAFRLAVADEATDLRPRYAAADCLVVAGVDGASADRVLEALAMGLPAIVGARSGGADFIEPGVNGWLSATGDAPDLARLMRAADEALAAGSMTEAARGSAERFGAEETGRRVAALYAAL